MPITQSRMIDLINATLDYKRGLEELIKEIHKLSQYRKDGFGTGDDYLYQLATLANIDALMQNHAKSLAILSLEYQHFNKYAKKNSKLAEKMALRRAEDGVTPRARTPTNYFLKEAKDLPRPAQLTRPKMQGLSPETQAKVLEEANQTAESGELDQYCPHCGTSDPTKDCHLKPCKWQEFWTSQLKKEELEEEADDLKL